MQNLYARDDCGNPIGSTYPGHILTLASSEVSSARFDTVTAFADEADLGYLAYPFKYANLNWPIPWSAYSGQSSCYCVYGIPNPEHSGSYPCSTIVNSDYRPALVVPPQIRTLDPLWAYCVLLFGGFHDPPHVLTAQSSPAAPVVTEGTSPGVAPTASTAIPVPTVPALGAKLTNTPEPDEDPSPAIKPHIPIADSASPTRPLVTGLGSDDPSLSRGSNHFPQARPSQNVANPSRSQGATLAAGSSTQNHGSGGNEHGDPPAPNDVWGAISPVLHKSSASKDRGDTSSKAAVADGDSESSDEAHDGSNVGDTQVQGPGHYEASGSSEGSGVESDRTGHDDTIPATVGVGSNGVGRDGAMSVDDPVATIGRLSIAVDPWSPDVAVVNGQKVTSDAQATKIGDVPVSFGSQGLVVGGGDGKVPTTIARFEIGTMQEASLYHLDLGN